MTSPIFRQYIAGPTDEYALQEDAKKIISEEIGDRSINKDDIRNIQNNHGIDKATMALYLHFTQDKKHKNSFDSLNKISDKQKQLSTKQNKPLRILIIPGFFWDKFPEFGADAKILQQAAAYYGFNSELIKTNERGTIANNAKIIASHIETIPKDERIWIISVSKGTAETRLYLQGLSSDDSLWNRLDGWINFTGIFSGTFLADERVNSWSKFYYKLLYSLLGINFNCVKELQCRHSYWQKKFDLNCNMRLIHVLGFPLAWHVQSPLINRWSNLAKKYGPTDGIIALSDSLDWPGEVYPLWGVDHLMRTPNLTNLSYRLMNLITQTSLSKKSIGETNHV